MAAHTPWKYGLLEEEERIAPEVGNRFLYIDTAELVEDDPSKPYFRLNVTDLQNSATISVRYYLLTRSKSTGNTFRNRHTFETLLTLGRALYGPDMAEAPNPVDIAGGVVIGAVSQRSYEKKDGSTGSAYDVTAFFAAPKDWVEEFSSMEDQYYEGKEGGE